MATERGGARAGTGPVRRRFTLSYGTAVLLRELTRSLHQRREVSEAELTAVLEQALRTAVEARLVDHTEDTR